MDDLFEKQDATFEESIRIDRKFEEDEDRAAHRDQLYRHYLDTYHITDASENFLGTSSLEFMATTRRCGREPITGSTGTTAAGRAIC